MRIRTILRTTVWASIAMGLLLAVTSYLFAQRLSEISALDERGRASARAVAELLVLTNEYALHAESRAAAQWKTQYETLMQALSGDAASMNNAMLNQANSLPAIFSKLEEISDGQANHLQERRKEFFLDQLLTNVRALSDAVHRWSGEIDAS
jgi:hypothetical protein